MILLPTFLVIITFSVIGYGIIFWNPLKGSAIIIIGDILFFVLAGQLIKNSISELNSSGVNAPRRLVFFPLFFSVWLTFAAAVAGSRCLGGVDAADDVFRPGR